MSSSLTRKSDAFPCLDQTMSNNHEPVSKCPKIRVPRSIRRKTVEACEKCREKRIKVRYSGNQAVLATLWTTANRNSVTESGPAIAAAGRATSAV